MRLYRLTAERVAATLLLVDSLTTPVEPLSTQPVVVRDPQDEPIHGMALAGRATHLVTGDDDLLTLRSDPALGGMRIFTPRVFLDDLSREGEGDA